MATSVLMASDDDAREGEKNYGGFEELIRPENPRQNRRRKSKSNDLGQKKKQPQRGMGVAQLELERLRLQEKWKKMNHPNPLQSLNLHNHNYYLLPTSFPDPISAPTVNGLCGLNQALLLPSFGNGGSFSGHVGGSGVGVLSDQFLANPYGIGSSGNVAETSKELTSMPNIKCHSGRCGQCHKKMRLNGENLGCSFLEFNLENNQNIDGQNQDFSGSSGINVDQDVEVLAVHRMGNPWGGGVFVEYEFFPKGKGGRGTSSNEFDTGFGSTEASVAECGDQSSYYVSTTTTSTGFDSSNSIDLSLKLSY
ncbi:hypothetical protein CsSME_00026344 [Camellia sinensis var. sinensis]